MALDAVRVDDAGNLARVGGRGGRRGCFSMLAFDRTAGRCRGRRSGLRTLQHRAKGVLKVVLARSLAREVHAVLVAHRAAVDQRAGGIDHEDLGGRARIEGIHDRLVPILEVKPLEPGISHLLAHGILRVEATDVDVDERDPLLRELRLDARERGRELPAERAGHAGQRDHRGALATTRSPRARCTVERRAGCIGHHAADTHVPRIARRWRCQHGVSGRRIGCRRKRRRGSQGQHPEGRDQEGLARVHPVGRPLDHVGRMLKRLGCSRAHAGFLPGHLGMKPARRTSRAQNRCQNEQPFAQALPGLLVQRSVPGSGTVPDHGTPDPARLR